MTRYSVGQSRDYDVWHEDDSGEEHKYCVTLKMTVPPVPAMGPSYSHGGLPPEPAEYEIIAIVPAPANSELRESIEGRAQELADADNWEWEPPEDRE